jgi:hypothetical protein
MLVSNYSASKNNKALFLWLIFFCLRRDCNAWISWHSAYSTRHVSKTSGGSSRISVRSSTIDALVPSENTDTSVLLKQFRSGEVPFITVKNFVPPSMVQRLLFDAQDLERFNFGSIAGVGQKSQLATMLDGKKLDQTIRKNVRQIWLRSNDGEEPNIFTSVYRILANRWTHTPLIGDLNARNELIALVEKLRHDLAVGLDNDDGKSPQDVIDGIRLLHPRMIELSYLSYYPGSFYRRHIDTFTSSSRSKRVVSFILYLGGDSTGKDDDSSRSTWCLETDGGALRVYGEDYAKYTNQPLIPCRNDAIQTFQGSGGEQQVIDEDLSTEDKVYADVPPLPGKEGRSASYVTISHHSFFLTIPDFFIDLDRLQVQWLYLTQRKFHMLLWKLDEVDDVSLVGSMHLYRIERRQQRC